jgi:hypothetical protein
MKNILVGLSALIAFYGSVYGLIVLINNNTLMGLIILTAIGTVLATFLAFFVGAVIRGKL